MRQVVPFLSDASRGLALCAVLAGVGQGLLDVIGADMVCFDTCPTRDTYFTGFSLGSVWVLTPCVVLEVLAVAAFLAYCLATRQARRAVIALLVLLVGGLVGVAALSPLMQQAATLPVWGGDAGDLLGEAPLQAWMGQWGLALMLVAGAWSGILAALQWRR